MIHTKDHKQLDIFNPFAHLGTKRLTVLESSWAHLFREEILHNLPAEKLFRFYDEFQGRKTKELYAMLGLVLIQQMEDCTDEQAIQHFALNLMWQYALNIRDMQQVRLAATVKATGLNIRRSTTFRNRQKRYKTPKNSKRPMDQCCKYLILRNGQNSQNLNLITFLVTASGLVLRGIGSAFWGLLLGLAVLKMVPRKNIS
jgi:hypothetical protein